MPFDPEEIKSPSKEESVQEVDNISADQANINILTQKQPTTQIYGEKQVIILRGKKRVLGCMTDKEFRKWCRQVKGYPRLRKVSEHGDSEQDSWHAASVRRNQHKEVDPNAQNLASLNLHS